MKDFVKHQDADHKMDHSVDNPVEKIDTVDSTTWQITLLSARLNK
jgi:hypothetical protein